MTDIQEDDDGRQLGELFVELTGETVLTESQDPETRKDVLDAADEEDPPDEPPGTRDGLADALADPEPE